MQRFELGVKSITKDEIVQTALRILQEQGLEAVTTRKLAEILKVQGPALYHHYRNKQELLGDMANAIVSAPVAEIDPRLAWDKWCAAFAVAVRQALLPYRDGARLLVAASPSEEMRTQTIPRIEAPLTAAGFSEQRSHEIAFLLASTVIGWLLNEQNARIRQFMDERLDSEAAFARAIETILDGVRSQAARNDGA